MRILLIGGTGVLSSDIRELSVKKGYDVYIINRGQSKDYSISKEVKLLIGNIRDINQTKKLIKDLYFDVVVDFLSFSVEDLKGTLEIFNNKCEQFIFVSSATAYRETQKGEKITEKYELNNKNWQYANKKKECEEYLEENFKKNGQKYTIIRPYVTYSKTRIPFAIIPEKEQWTLIYRLMNNKPIVLWDGGQANCTLTSTVDFAIGVVGLFKNDAAYGEAFHITTEHILTWKDALIYIAKACELNPNIISIPSEYIIKKMPEYKGVLLGDKALDREFDNTKIKTVVPSFEGNIKFEEGIKETIKFYFENEYMQKINHEWDSRIDELIKDYICENSNMEKNNLDFSKLKCFSKKTKDRFVYAICKNKLLYEIYKKCSIFKRILNKIKGMIKKYAKK